MYLIFYYSFLIINSHCLLSSPCKSIINSHIPIVPISTTESTIEHPSNHVTFINLNYTLKKKTNFFIFKNKKSLCFSKLVE